MRRTIATRLVQAKQTIPHFYLTIDVDIGPLLKLREDANASAPQGKDGKAAFKLSVNDFVIKAWAAALQRVPAANAVWADDRILRFKRSDVAVAVAIEGGLITPVIREADTKRLSAISAEMKDLAARARDRKLKPNEYQGGSSAISNLGMFGVREFSAIINPPHATILAVGGARRQAVEKEDGGVAFASLMTVISPATTASSTGPSAPSCSPRSRKSSRSRSPRWCDYSAAWVVTPFCAATKSDNIGT